MYSMLQEFQIYVLLLPISRCNNNSSNILIEDDQSEFFIQAFPIILAITVTD